MALPIPMYTDAEPHLDRILALVEKCPEALRATCFEILLTGYVDGELARAADRGSRRGGTGGGPGGADGDVGAAGSSNSSGGAGAGGAGVNGSGGGKEREAETESQVPAGLLVRFRNTAKRLTIELGALEALFDFSADPVDFHALHVQGKDDADKTRKVALLVAARSYLTSGHWVADWKEVKAQCVNQSCYNRSNFAAFLKRGHGSVFSKLEVGDRLELSGAGIKEAEALLTSLAGAAAKAAA